MRLTLRTLLAYLDDILDPSDKEELAKKIESSGFAEDLVHRTKDTMRRLRLSAPQVVGTGMGLDANSVAEYLDNVLPPDSVGDFERICLESDVHLAEVASCHHVLTMVLGEPADVDVSSKQRIYGIPAELEERKRVRVEAAHVPASQPLAVAEPIGLRPAVLLPAVDQSRVMEIPDYLRASGWSRYRGAVIGLAALLLLAATVYLLYGAKGWFGGSDGMNVASTTAPQSMTPSAPSLPSVFNEEEPRPSAPITDTGAPIAVSNERYSAAPLSSPPQPLTPGVAPLVVEPPVDTRPNRYQVSATPTTLATESERSMPNGSAIERSADPSSTTPSPYDVSPSAGTPVAAPANMPTIAASNPPNDTVAVTTPPQDVSFVTGLPSDRAIAPTPPVVTEPPAEQSEPVIKKPVDVGTYLGGKTVLLRQNAAADGWYRIPPREAVMEGETLVSLPLFRPTITLTSGIHLDLSGETMIGLRTAKVADGSGAGAEVVQPAIEVMYGRVVLINRGSSENMVRLTLGPTTADVKLSPKAMLGLEVERSYVPGHDPRKSPAPVVVHVYAPEGNVEWRDAAGTQTIDKPSAWTIRDGVAADIQDELTPPGWIDQEPAGIKSEQDYGAPEIERRLTSDRPADLQLLELYEGGQRREVKSLVARSSGHVGLLKPLIDALNDPNQRPNWEMLVTVLRQSMAQSPESADRVWNMLVKQRGETAAADLYEMLCGYGPEQIGSTADERKTGALARLIDWMGNDNLDYRVLAVYDLKEITGKRPMDPADRLKERQQVVKSFKRRLESGELRPATHP